MMGEIPPGSKVALSLASLAIVLWLLAQQVDAVSPGPLAGAHVQEHELVARGACERCHGGDGLAMADACGECHAEILADIAAGTGFHGTLAGLDARACGRCHGEHAGGDFPLVSTRSFALAGFATRADYDHAELDFRLQGRHAELDCKECHGNADVLLLARGETRFLGLDQGCQACHEDAHEGRIARACGDCHGQEHPFSLVASFEHDSFERSCAHAALSCQECHPKGGAHDAELLAGHEPPSCGRVCQDCHVSPHSDDFVAAAAVLSGLPAGEGCAPCHSESMGAFDGHREAMPPELHAASGFALDAPHDGLDCASCHQDVSGDPASFSVHAPARAPDECRTCHGDPHDGRFADGPFARAACLDCHEREAFEPSAFGIEAHQSAAFALEGSHQAVACSRCHEADPRGSPRDFRRSSACAECHADAHRGVFDERLLEAGAPRDCAHCHDPTRFAEVDEEAFEHGRWTGYELDGAHARTECTDCHEPAVRPDENGRTFGVVTELVDGPVERCDTCHADVHDGRFDRSGMPAEVGGRTDCARCHTSESFTAPPEDFDHERWTGYPMAAFHARVECAQCHLPAATPDALGRTFGRAPARCQDCHADPHVAQFAVGGATDCARCHEDAGGLAFDHQRDSRFALDEVHAPLECSACHVPWPLPGGGEAVRYKPLGVECVDCHDPGFLERAKRSGRGRSSIGGLSLSGGRR